MAWRIVKQAAGKTRIQLIPNKCKFMISFGVLCGEPVRTEPGAVFCLIHQDAENAGCAEHDKLNCKEEGCRR